MTLIMKESARCGDYLTVDSDMGIRPVRAQSDPFIGWAAKDLSVGQYADVVQNEIARENLRWAWVRFAK